MHTLWGEAPEITSGIFRQMPRGVERATKPVTAKKKQKALEWITAEPPLRPITASAFTAELHSLARKTNGTLKILDNCPSNIVELPDYFVSLKPVEVACGFKACIVEALANELDSRGLLTRKESKGIVSNLLRSLAIAQDKLIETGCELAWSQTVSKGRRTA